MEMATMLTMLGKGFLVSLQIFFFTLLGSLPLGLMVAFGRMSKFKPLSLLVQLYISIMRGTPLMLQLMVVYYVPYFGFGISMGDGYRFTATIIAFVINYSAYFAEIYRSGIQSIPRGQYEASGVLGYSRVQTFFLIVFPQVIKRILPPVTNEVITLVKDTSLSFVLSVPEMFTTARAIAAAQKAMTSFVVAGVFYYIFNLVVASAMNFFEKKMNYYHE
ncbi:MAG: amino acid ABC transporter permease [Eggerthellaceae bacterium]|jgi:polar amino acid transport system permease protein|nr:amino acid ABC transporter permease [Eggerthellaceae bacterium]MDR2722044.1 amino acid ABC transporter permease [Coriobacteriaceae bacterium]